MTARWFATALHPNAERTAEVNLERQGFDIFVPWCIWRRRHHGRVQESRTLLLGAYLFAQFDRDDDTWRPINSTTGVKKLLPMALETPLPLPVGFVERLQEASAAGSFNFDDGAAIVAEYAAGELLQVTSGSFVGQSGSFQRARKGLVHMLLSCMGRETTVKIPAHQVRSLSSEPTLGALSSVVSGAPTSRKSRLSETAVALAQPQVAAPLLA